jgi:hypothetical protein
MLFAVGSGREADRLQLFFDVMTVRLE